ncbi:type VII secretion integral membrane protein EccD [Mycobacterium sp. 141]|uniref:type VII secretion integral membrane protein EccD n=1 Tax=Mycobacterium sp. 141 TaxID=1120797 RepID=UPI001E44C366|nr:type VII secretion integral membrane protein EccD [Mycobacterium sp. 141]
MAIHCELPDADESATVDLTLPSSMAVRQLIPAITDAVGAGTGLRHWSLSRVGGPSLDESMSLAQNDVRDGDLLLLSATTVPKPRPRDPSLASALAAIPDDLPATLRPACCLAAVLLGALTLLWAGGSAPGAGGVATAAALAIAVTGAAIVARRVHRSPESVTALDLGAMLQVAVFGFLAVPGGPAPANVFLAAVASASVGVVLLRLSDCGTVVLIAVLAVAATVAVATGLAVIRPIPAAALGALLATAALGALTIAPRLSIALAGLTPAVPGDHDDADDVTGRALVGHRALVGLVTGLSVAAGLGTVLVAVGARQSVPPAALAFTGAVAVALVLRARSHASGLCRTSLIAAGFAAATATFVLTVAWSPMSANWAAGVAVGVGLTALVPVVPTTAATHRAVRIIDATEYLALASMVPLACWLAGLFELARGLSLS